MPKELYSLAKSHLPSTIEVYMMTDHIWLNALAKIFHNNTRTSALETAFRQIIGDAILINAPVQYFSYSAVDVQQVEDSMQPFIAQLTSKVQAEATLGRNEMTTTALCSQINIMLTQWVQGFKTKYHDNLKLLFVPSLFNVMAPSEATEDQIVAMYTNYAINYVQQIKAKYLIKYQQALTQQKLIVHSNMLKVFCQFFESQPEGMIDMNHMQPPTAYSTKYKLKHRPEGLLVTAKSFPSDAPTASEEIFRCVYVFECLIMYRFSVNPNSARVLHVINIHGTQHILFERLEVSLHEFIQHEPLTLSDKINLMLQLSEFIGVWHSYGMAHCNLLPSRLFVQNGNRIVVVGAENPKHDKSYTVIRTAYVPPEAVLVQPDTFRSTFDIYSLGVIFFEIATGKKLEKYLTPALVNTLESETLKSLILDCTQAAAVQRPKIGVVIQTLISLI